MRPARDDGAGQASRWWHRRAARTRCSGSTTPARCSTAPARCSKTGWVQNRWYVLAPRPHGRRSSLLRTAVVAPNEVAAACLVGALALALREHDPRADLLTGRSAALDAVWEAVREAWAGCRPARRPGRRPWPREAPSCYASGTSRAGTTAPDGPGTRCWPSARRRVQPRDHGRHAGAGARHSLTARLRRVRMHLAEAVASARTAANPARTRRTLPRTRRTLRGRGEPCEDAANPARTRVMPGRRPEGAAPAGRRRCPTRPRPSARPPGRGRAGRPRGASPRTRRRRASDPVAGNGRT